MKRKHNYRRYPRYMFPRKDYHRIPHIETLKSYSILRYMIGESMPPDTLIDFDTMKRTMKDAHFYNGMSVNLLSKFKKEDAVYFIADKDLTDYWNYRSKSPKVLKKFISFKEDQGYYGFRIGDVESIESTFDVYNKKGDVERTDKVFCKVEHWPTRVNFWHFNIFLYGIETLSDNKEVVYRLDERLKDKKVKSIAAGLMDDFYDVLLTKNDLYEIRLPFFLYRKGKKWRRFLKQHKDITY